MLFLNETPKIIFMFFKIVIFVDKKCLVSNFNIEKFENWRNMQNYFYL